MVQEIGSRKHSKLLLPVTSAIMFFLGFESGAYQMALLQVAMEFHLGQSVMGMLVGAQFFAIMLGPPLLGRAADKFGKKRILLIFMPVFIAGCIFTGNAGGVAAFVAGIFVLGFGFSVCECVTCALIVDAYGDRADKYNNLIQSLFSIGAVAGPLVAAWLMNSMGFTWRAVFLAAGIGYAAIYPFLCFTKTESTAVAAADARPVRLKSFFKNGFFIVLFVAMFVYCGLENGIAYFADSLFTLTFSEAGLSAYAIALFWLAMGVSRLIFSLANMKPQATMLAFYILAAAVLMALAFSLNAILAFVLIGVAGFLCGPVWPVIISQGSNLFPGATGMASSILMVAVGLGGALTPMLVGAVSEAVGMHASYIVLAAFSAVVAALLIWQKRKRARQSV